MKGLPDIPQIDLGRDGAAALARAYPERLRDLVCQARRRYTGLGLGLADRMAHRWLASAANPYLPEIEAVAALAGCAGTYLLNVSYEMACTSAVVPSKDGGFRLVRVLDWKLNGLGRTLVLARQEGPAGPFHSLTWPGYAGVLTGIAAGRFAAAINQPPHGGGVGQRLVGRMQVWRRGGLPPAHLLRQVFETAPDYETARRMLIETRVAVPAIFVLAGCGPSDGCVIERTPFEAAVRPAPAAVANHWVSMTRPGKPRGIDSHGRQRAMERLLKHPPNHFHWLAPPVLNKDTRLVALADPATGFLRAQGFEKSGAVTHPLNIDL